VLFHLCAGRALFLADAGDNLPALDPLARWSPESLERALKGSVDDADARDLLAWLLERKPESRPESAEQALRHRFLDPAGGSLRKTTLVSALASTPLDPGGPSVFFSYCWANQETGSTHDGGNWGPGVLQLVADLAPSCRNVWLDVIRLKGGEWLEEAFQKGIAAADVVVACVSHEYLRSANCGVEMRLSNELGKPVLPLMLGRIPFGPGDREWPPTKVGPENPPPDPTPMATQFSSKPDARPKTADKLFIQFPDARDYPALIAQLRSALLAPDAPWRTPAPL